MILHKETVLVKGKVRERAISMYCDVCGSVMLVGVYNCVEGVAYTDKNEVTKWIKSHSDCDEWDEMWAQAYEDTIYPTMSQY